MSARRIALNRKLTHEGREVTQSRLNVRLIYTHLSDPKFCPDVLTKESFKLAHAVSQTNRAADLTL